MVFFFHLGIDTCLLRAMVRLPPPGVSLVTVEPAAIYEPFPTLTGATSLVPEPINELLSINV